MSNPRNYKSIDGVSAVGAGEMVRANGHYHVTLFVAASGLDSANDTLTVSAEGSPDGQVWTGVGEATSDKKLTESDFSEDPDNAGVYTASITITAAYHEFYRARIEALTDSANGDLTVDAWVMAAGNAGAGVKGQPHGP